MSFRTKSTPFTVGLVNSSEASGVERSPVLSSPPNEPQPCRDVDCIQCHDIDSTKPYGWLLRKSPTDPPRPRHLSWILCRSRRFPSRKSSPAVPKLSPKAERPIAERSGLRGKSELISLHIILSGQAPATYLRRGGILFVTKVRV